MEKKIEEQLKRLPKYIEDSGNKYFLEPGIIGDDFDVVVIDYVDNKSMYRDLLFSVENIDTTLDLSERFKEVVERSLQKINEINKQQCKN